MPAGQVGQAGAGTSSSVRRGGPAHVESSASAAITRNHGRDATRPPRITVVKGAFERS